MVSLSWHTHVVLAVYQSSKALRPKMLPLTIDAGTKMHGRISSRTEAAAAELIPSSMLPPSNTATLPSDVDLPKAPIFRSSGGTEACYGVTCFLLEDGWYGWSLLRRTVLRMKIWNGGLGNEWHGREEDCTVGGAKLYMVEVLGIYL